ncbi:MAG: methyltransferase domain-containing protein [Lentisphaerota bacterium]
MKYLNKCLICESEDIKQHSAMVVPFIAERVWGRKAFGVKLNQCRKCGFSFFNARLDDAEMTRLYSGYRDEEYLKQRNKHEPWYTQKLQERLFADKTTLKNRHYSLSGLFKKLFGNIRIKCILDFGGDKGQLIDGIFDDAEKFVHEVSDVEPLSGIKKADPHSMIPYDLVICSNVLEHVSSPADIINQISQFVTKNKTILYIDVPLENPYDCKILTRRIIQILLLFLLRFKDFMAMFGSGMLTNMHEHINYFTEESLRMLLIKNDFDNIKISIEQINNYKIICCFCTKK